MTCTSVKQTNIVNECDTRYTKFSDAISKEVQVLLITDFIGLPGWGGANTLRSQAGNGGKIG